MIHIGKLFIWLGQFLLAASTSSPQANALHFGPVLQPLRLMVGCALVMALP